MYSCSQLLPAEPLAGCCAGGTSGVSHNLVFVQSHNSNQPQRQRSWGYGVLGAASRGVGLSPLTNTLLHGWSDPTLQPGPVPRGFHPKLTSGKICSDISTCLLCCGSELRRGLRSREGTALSSGSTSSGGQQKLGQQLGKGTAGAGHYLKLRQLFAKRT